MLNQRLPNQDLNEQKIKALRKILPSVSRETEDNLLRYEELVRKWQPHINLIANATLPDLWQRHILDSVQLFPLKSEYKNWLDLGSGGGFPGIVCAILLKSTGGHINLVESNQKKVSFLRTVAAELNLPVDIHCMRIEDLTDEIKQPDVITARALASLDMLFGLIFPIQGKNTVGLLQKGRDYRLEVEKARQHWQFNLIEHKSRIDDQSIILEISDLEKGTKQ